MRNEEDGLRLGRREFTAQSVMALLAGVTVTVSGCGGGSGGGGASPTAPSPTAGEGDVTGSISANHGHTAVVTAAELRAGNAVTLDIRGGADHPHTVDLSGAEVQQIAARQRVVKRSSNDASHTHDVTFN